MTAPALRTYANAGTEISGDNLNTFQQTCNTFDDLRAFIGTTGIQVFARGRDAINDGYGGVFYWSGASTSADDDLDIIAPTGEDEGRWIRVVSGVSVALIGSATVDFPSCADGDMEAGDANITVTGAELGDFVLITASIALTADTFLFGTVSAANTVIPYIGNMSGGAVDMASCTVYALVFKRAAQS